MKNIKIGSIVRWRGGGSGIILKVDLWKERKARDRKLYTIYWFNEKMVRTGHSGFYLEVLVP